MSRKKKCCGCGRHLALAAYHKQVRGKHGRQARCIECRADARKGRGSPQTDGPGRPATTVSVSIDAGLLEEISSTDWSAILAVMVEAAKSGDRRAGEFLLRCRAAAEPVDQSRASSTQTRKALVACMRELRKSPDFHDRGRALIEDIIRAGPDKALEVVGVEGAP